MNKQILLRGNGDFTNEQFEQVLRANDEKHMMLSLGLTTSPGCNMRCVFCYSDSGTREAGNEIRKLMDLNDFDHIYLVGGGKATAPMARAMEDLLGNNIDRGIITVKYGFTEPLDLTEVG